MPKILIIEDNEQLSALLAKRLSRRGHEIAGAGDAEAALSVAKASQPDVILLDSQLRGDDDWRTARALKFDDHTRDIPIIALMANNSPTARALARQNGAADLHAKPVDFVKLLRQIGAAAIVKIADPAAQA